MLRSLVRQLLHVWRQSMRLLEEFLALLVFHTTPFTSCVCHLCVALVLVWFGRPSIEREVQLDFRVHSSSCGAICGVVHSPFDWLDHRCHCDCRVLVLFVDRLPCCGGVCVAMSYGGWFFTPDGAYDSVWDSVKPMTGNFFFYYFQYQEFVGCVCNDDICPDNYNYSRFTLKDKCRSEKWEVYLYGDMTIKVMGSRRAENCGVLRSCSSWRDGKAFLGRVHRYTARGDPLIRAGKEWRGRRELAPRCSATQLGACVVAYRQRHVINIWSVPPQPPQPPQGVSLKSNRLHALPVV